jgi:RNA polymerase sigma-70 factor, ECF subfamily
VQRGGRVSERERVEDELPLLMLAYQGGDPIAFDYLYTVLAPGLLGYLRSLTRDRQRAEDLLQETFMQLHKARATYLHGRPVKPWVYAIARNVFLMQRRAAARRGRREVLADEELPELPVPPEVESLADRDALRRALARLPDDRREALVLHHLMGMSFKEVGAVQGTSEGAAKVKAHRAIAQLREMLGAGGGR